MSSNPARTRRRLMAALALGLILVLPCALALQLGAGPRTPLLVGAISGAALAALASLGLTGLQLGALAYPREAEILYDELSTRNTVRAMAIGYVAALAVAGLSLPVAAWLSLPATPLLTALVIVAVIAHAASFAWFERQGDDDDG